ncbi:type II toxin-antitoxin system HicB family antitoxin [Agrococcus casei]|uniref:type II toxin-antitoxin system HicB family antitoxin n=1 Tax=Agrococcus casei TaxID=343512 RepID=UPI003F903D76
MTYSDHYTYRVRWSAEDAAFVGTVAEWPSLSWVADSNRAAFEGIQTLVSDVLEEMRAAGETVPEPIADRRYSGKFMVRIPPEAHRELALAAAEQDVSINRLVSSRLISTSS